MIPIAIIELEKYADYPLHIRSKYCFFKSKISRTVQKDDSLNNIELSSSQEIQLEDNFENIKEKSKHQDKDKDEKLGNLLKNMLKGYLNSVLSVVVFLVKKHILSFNFWMLFNWWIIGNSLLNFIVIFIAIYPYQYFYQNLSYESLIFNFHYNHNNYNENSEKDERFIIDG